MYNIAIDGPAGAGKSTIAKQVAKRLGFVYVDTGAMFRAMALYMLEHQTPLSDEQAVSEACGQISITISYVDGEQQVILNGDDVTGQIRQEQVGNAASRIAVYASVRTKLLELQRELAANENVIMDGRDIGTAVLPHAQTKIYLTASALERARRRVEQLRQSGVTASLSEVEKDIRARDEQDMNREIAPLRQAEDAVFIDSSDLDIEAVVQAIVDCYEKDCRAAEG